jgi:hypothetical protein
MHSFTKFAAVFALALLALTGQLAALEIIVGPLVPALTALSSDGQPRVVSQPCRTDERRSDSPASQQPGRGEIGS